MHGRVISLDALSDLLRVDEARFQRRGDDGLEIAPAEIRVGILARDDLALLGEADAAGEAAGCLGEDRIVRRSAAASDRAAATVEQPQGDGIVRLRAHLDERALGAIE